MAMNEIKENVLSLLKENKGNEIIFDWIDDNVCGSGDPLFIRALVTAVHEYVITGLGANCKLATQELKTRTALLKHYVKHNEKHELQALYAIQVLMNQLGQPSGILSDIFNILYDNNVISGETFRIWEVCTDPDESEGRDLAVLSSRSFFIRLRTKEQPEKEKLKRSVQGVLNKLTPQKFETLLRQFKALHIDTEEKLKIVIDLIIENAVHKLNFSVLYANLCKHLVMIKVPGADQDGGQVNFRNLLLNKCQKEFEQDRSDELKHDERMKALVEAEPGGGQVNFRKLLLTKCQKEFEQDRSDELKHEERMKALEEAEPDKQKEMKLEFDLEKKNVRYRQLGNIRFIGELFKLGMLIEPIMHECIKKLLSQGDEESLECLCELLKTIGKELEDSKGSKSSPDQSPMDLYFAQMQKYVDKRLTSSRVRFILQDVIDLKKCSWVPRRDENIPKTINQIHQEAEREARKQQINLQNMSSSNYPKRMPDDRDRRKTSGRNSMSDDGWTASSSKSSYRALDSTKLKLTKKLESTVCPTKVKPNVQMAIEEIKKKLISLLKENEVNESVFDWIDVNVFGNSEPAFIRALVTAVHEHVITGSGTNCELSNQQLKNRTALLTRYINHNAKLELQALYAIQALMNQLEQPSGLLRQIFDILYDDDVITEETFKVWESSTDPNESEGKGVAVHSVKSFFTWLRQSESGEESEE